MLLALMHGLVIGVKLKRGQTISSNTLVIWSLATATFIFLQFKL
jgi:hypothetical protein